MSLGRQLKRRSAPLAASASSISHSPVALARLGSRRLTIWAVGLVLIGLSPVAGAFLFGYHDWPAFWSAGATAGTSDLVGAARHVAWQRVHGLPEAFFPYPAGAAWLFAPLAALPLPIGFVANGLLMLAAAAAAAVVLAGGLGLDRRTAILATLAFGPVTASVTLGQNGPLGLLLAAGAILGLVNRRPVLAGLAIGLLLYKPTYAAPLIGLLILRRRWAELAVVGAVGVGWYLAGVLAAGGDWLWPQDWLGGLQAYLDADFARNADKAVSLPGLLTRLPIPAWLPLLGGGVLVLAVLPRLTRAPMLEASVAACLVGVAVSPHAWGYDAALVVPFLLWLLRGHGPLADPARNAVLVAAYVLGLMWLFSGQTVLSSVAVVVLGLVAVWLLSAWSARSALPRPACP